MKTLEIQDLALVSGGAARRTNDALTQQLTQIGTSIKDAASANNNSQNNVLLPMVMMMAMNRNNGPTVVAAGAPAAPSSVVNISTRVRRW
ncbi:MAG: hypothetical protein KF773_32970 [Deltaproteobacteria bacterium]|nr:hypothetical protein [Deltaproteobacteria bacterium]MCW5801075.1 hypothetical protein [Deltaproteobacteria bacterium]